MIKIFIGPNGYGKTTKLQSIKDQLELEGHNDTILLESEILLLDEVKDTVDTSKTMEFIIDNLFNSSESLQEAKNNYENEVDRAVESNILYMNTIIDEILSHNQQTRSGNFISKTVKKEYKKLVKINTSDVKNKIGSGQRMFLILKLVSKFNSKNNIFLDEPEKYSHPSLLHKTAEIINDLSARGKNVYIATHSPKLVSMLRFDLDDIVILNDPNYLEKSLNLNAVLNQYSAHAITLNSPRLSKSLSYFNITDFKNNIKNFHLHEFIDCLFSKKIYIVEGVNDVLFIKKLLQQNNNFYEDYSIFQTYGKHHMILFAKIFLDLGIEVKVFFDEDNNQLPYNLSSNQLLSSFIHYKFSADIENEIGYTGQKANTVEFMQYLDSYTIPTNMNI